ncbi:MAG: MiaE family protein [Myxococcales bacterium]
MLGLERATDPGWVAVALSDIGRLLQDHAHCEKKAAATALSLVAGNPGRPEFVGPLVSLAQEETRHFFRVLAELERRGVPLGRCPADPYVRGLIDRLAPSGTDRLRDRLLVGSLIEARSCERFSLLAERCEDARLRQLWGDLFRAEAEHHGLFVRLAVHLCGAAEVRERLAELRAEEGEIVRALPLRVAIH